MNTRRKTRLLPAFRAALFALLCSPLAARAEDAFAEQRRRTRERAEEERRNAERREEDARRRIAVGKDQGERDLVDVDQYIRRAQDSLGAANLRGKEWVDANSREAPPEILALGRRVSAELAKVRRERSACGAALHSPSSLVSDTLRRISELDHQARALAEQADRLLASVNGLFVEDVREHLRVLDERLATAIAVINWAKKGIQKLEAEELRAAKDYLRKDLEEESKAERARKRAALQKDRSSSERPAVRRTSAGLRDAKEKMKLRTFDSNEAKLQLNDSIRNLEVRHRNLLRRREEVGKKLSDRHATVKENSEEVAVLDADVDSFCQEVDDLANLAEPYFGKAPVAAAASGEGGAVDAGDASEPPAEAGQPDPAPKARSGARFIYSWTPWDTSDSLSAERR